MDTHKDKKYEDNERNDFWLQKKEFLLILVHFLHFCIQNNMIIIRYKYIKIDLKRGNPTMLFKTNTFKMHIFMFGFSYYIWKFIITIHLGLIFEDLLQFVVISLDQNA